MWGHLVHTGNVKNTQAVCGDSCLCNPKTQEIESGGS